MPIAHYERRTELTFSRDPGLGPLKGPVSSKVVLMLSRAIMSLIFKHSDKNLE